MKVKVLVSFASVKYSGIPGDILDIKEEEVAKDLLQAGYVEEVAKKTRTTKKK